VIFVRRRVVRVGRLIICPLKNRVKVTIVIRFVGVSLVFLINFLPISGIAFDPSASPQHSLSQGSRYCLGCHDGVLATPILRTHSIDIDYLTALQRSRGKLRGLSQVTRSIHLKDGQVVCTSCHYPNSSLQAKLAMSNTGSRLCYSCHNL